MKNKKTSDFSRAKQVGVGQLIWEGYKDQDNYICNYEKNKNK